MSLNQSSKSENGHPSFDNIMLVTQWLNLTIFLSGILNCFGYFRLLFVSDFISIFYSILKCEILGEKYLYSTDNE